ncbi:ribosomal protein S5 domain 2-like protein [Rhizopogon vinicolor AM-OR11-026]|uniref:Ribosomal protein S5 domain 2-like protein n=1 Tax=Rhizopogon vinicolor AM-OR11-026 TaxID=1314800 RepID=A0A1B7NEQ2_9AGAM|nr:ribosomal protein S5 domain 2-like protein [Rhizopogon vinicolor AM-OR11-026]
MVMDTDDPDQAKLMQHFAADRESVASEINVLQSIYGDNAIHLYHSSSRSPGSNPSSSFSTTEAIRFEVSLNLPSHEDTSIRILVSIPPTYPSSSPPQLQLLSRYIGAFGVDSSLFGSILRTFISVSGVEWTPESVCVFDGLQNVLERCEAWYEDKISKEAVGELLREDARNDVLIEPDESLITPSAINVEKDRVSFDTALPEGIEIVEAEAIVDRKSIFVGRACRISHPSQVPLILNSLMSDRHISRAAHPIINAWRCQVGNVLHQDNDDNGETAAGSRLAHLLSILEINDVLVIVTRWFGGTHLGPDRFKHINHAARNALELGGFLEQTEEPKSGGRITGKGRKR